MKMIIDLKQETFGPSLFTGRQSIPTLPSYARRMELRQQFALPPSVKLEDPVECFLFPEKGDSLALGCRLKLYPEKNSYTIGRLGGASTRVTDTQWSRHWYVLMPDAQWWHVDVSLEQRTWDAGRMSLEVCLAQEKDTFERRLPSRDAIELDLVVIGETDEEICSELNCEDLHFAAWLEAKGDYGGAIDAVSKTIENSPHHEAYQYRAGLRLHAGDYAGAIEDACKASTIMPGNPHNYGYRARAKFALKDYVGTVQDTTEAIVRMSAESPERPALQELRELAKEQLVGGPQQNPA